MTFTQFIVIYLLVNLPILAMVIFVYKCGEGEISEIKEWERKHG